MAAELLVVMVVVVGAELKAGVLFARATQEANFTPSAGGRPAAAESVPKKQNPLPLRAKDKWKGRPGVPPEPQSHRSS